MLSKFRVKGSRDILLLYFASLFGSMCFCNIFLNNLFGKKYSLSKTTDKRCNGHDVVDYLRNIISYLLFLHRRKPNTKKTNLNTNKYEDDGRQVR